MIKTDFIVDYERYQIKYKTDKNGKYLNEYILKSGYSLFEVSASYAKSLKPSAYYVIAKNKREAKQIFIKRFDWLDTISYVKELANDTHEWILKNYQAHTYIII